ncbi:MAG: amino acid ABC transporter permease, partial [Rhodobacter sp.]|nr:amino acid ABC transporter permease [Rhodobacter sp.]
MTYKTDLPVMMPPSHPPRDALGFRLHSWHIILFVALCLIGPSLAFAAGGKWVLSPLAVLMNWTPLLLKGFVFNLVISVSAMAVGTVAG